MTGAASMTDSSYAYLLCSRKPKKSKTQKCDMQNCDTMNCEAKNCYKKHWVNVHMGVYVHCYPWIPRGDEVCQLACVKPLRSCLRKTRSICTDADGDCLSTESPRSSSSDGNTSMSDLIAYNSELTHKMIAYNSTSMRDSIACNSTSMMVTSAYNSELMQEILACKSMPDMPKGSESDLRRVRFCDEVNVSLSEWIYVDRDICGFSIYEYAPNDEEFKDFASTCYGQLFSQEYPQDYPQYVPDMNDKIDELELDNALLLAK